MGNMSSMDRQELKNIKIGFVFFIFFWSLIAGVLPAKIPACKNNTTFLSMVSAFSGGIFLAMALVHILPEVAEEYEIYKTPDEGQEEEEVPLFPLPYFLVFCGYALILLIDKVLFDSHALLDHGHGDGHGHGHDDHHHQHRLSEDEESNKDYTGSHVQEERMKINNTTFNDPATQKLVEQTKKSMMEIETLSKNSHLDQKQLSKSVAQKNKDITSHFKSYLSKAEKFSVRMSAAVTKNQKPKQKVNQEQQKLFVEEGNIKFKQEDESLHHHPQNKGFCNCNFTPFILMIALAFHSIFEGLAMGLNMDPVVVINLMISVIIHKYAECMSISTSLQKAFPDQFTFLFWLMFIYSFATPLGVVLGMILSGLSDLVDIVFMSMAGGTFLYVACTEIIVEEFSMPGYRIWKALCFLFGAAVITLLWFLDQE